MTASVSTTETAPGKRVLNFTCECGDMARFGRNADPRAALAQRDVRLAGEWTCGPDGCRKKGKP